MEEQAPFIYRSFSSDGTSSEAALLKAAFDGNLDRIKGTANPPSLRSIDPPLIRVASCMFLRLIHLIGAYGDA